MKPVQTFTPAKASNILNGIDGFGGSLANSDESLHRLHLLLLLSEVTLTNCFPHEFRDGSLSTPCSSVKGIPEMIVKVQLRPPHDVYYTSLRAGQDHPAQITHTIDWCLQH